MKKALLILSLFAGIASGASAQCTPNPADTLHFNSTVHSYPDTVYAVNAVALSGQVITFNIPSDLSYTVPFIGTLEVPVDSMSIDSITGAPSAIIDAASPVFGTWLKPGQQGCVSFTGTTTVPAGNYSLTVTGTARLDTTIFSQHIDTVVPHFPLSSTYPMTVNVSNPLGISEISEGLNMSIYPNPNQGKFTLTLSSSEPISGEMTVIDQLGRVVHVESIEINGTRQLPLELANLSPGAYILVVNAGGKRSVQQFIIQ